MTQQYVHQDNYNKSCPIKQRCVEARPTTGVSRREAPPIPGFECRVVREAVTAPYVFQSIVCPVDLDKRDTAEPSRQARDLIGVAVVVTGYRIIAAIW